MTEQRFLLDRLGVIRVAIDRDEIGMFVKVVPVTLGSTDRYVLVSPSDRFDTAGDYWCANDSQVEALFGESGWQVEWIDQNED
jgi:hypothetical protein